VNLFSEALNGPSVLDGLADEVILDVALEADELASLAGPEVWQL